MANDFPFTKVPAVVPGVSGATAVYTGDFHTCVLISGGVWGYGALGALGNGTTGDALSPASVLFP